MRQLTPTEPDETLIAEGRYICYSRMPCFDDDAESRCFIERMIEDARRRFESEGLDVIYVYDEHKPERIIDWLTPSGVFESWSLHQLSNGFRLLRVDRDGQRGDGYTMLAELLFKPPEQGGQIHSALAKVDYGASGVGDIYGSASYTFYEDRIMTSRDISRRHVFEGIQSWSEHDEILEMPEGYLVSTGTTIGDSVVIDQMTHGLPKPEITVWPQEDPWHRLYEQVGRPVFVLLRHDGILTVDSGS